MASLLALPTVLAAQATILGGNPSLAGSGGFGLPPGIQIDGFTIFAVSALILLAEALFSRPPQRRPRNSNKNEQ